MLPAPQNQAALVHTYLYRMRSSGWILSRADWSSAASDSCARGSACEPVVTMITWLGSKSLSWAGAIMSCAAQGQGESGCEGIIN
eukprot:805999-Pelagomonas_calceolata.AAC.1